MFFAILHVFFIGCQAKLVVKDSIFSPEVHDDGVVLFIKTSSFDDEDLSIYLIRVFWVDNCVTTPETISTIK